MIWRSCFGSASTTSTWCCARNFASASDSRPSVTRIRIGRGKSGGVLRFSAGSGSRRGVEEGAVHPQEGEDEEPDRDRESDDEHPGRDGAVASEGDRERAHHDDPTVLRGGGRHRAGGGGGRGGG